MAAVSSVQAVTGESVSINPATGETLAKHPWLDDGGVDSLLIASREAFLRWRGTGQGARAVALRRLAEVLERRIEELARNITLEMGKPVAQSREEVLKCSRLCSWYADNLGALLADDLADVGGDGRAVISYRPLGTVVGVMPWNFPFWQVLRAAVPILAAGNAFILKHADNVQCCALALVDAVTEAGFPTGLFANFNVHHSKIRDLLADPHIVGVTVTGGVAAGATIAAEAGRNLKRSVLELGGSDPFIVLADADLERAVPAAIEARFQNSGQVCIAAKRLILERSVAEQFTRQFVDRVRELRCGDPLSPETQLGPLARVRIRDELHAQVKRSVAMGAKLLLGGEVPSGPGAFYPPTVLANVRPDMPVFREETFGPVAAIAVARDANEAVRLANHSEFGLSGALWSTDIAGAEHLAAEIETGAIYINGIAVSDPRVPIGGIKKSGYGRELSHFGLREFCNIQLKWVRP